MMAYRLKAPPLQIPDGRYAELEEMIGFGSTLRDFIQQQEILLHEIASAARHNEIVDYLNQLSNSYNQQLKLFKDAELTRQRQRPAFAALVHAGPISSFNKRLVWLGQE